MHYVYTRGERKDLNLFLFGKNVSDFPVRRVLKNKIEVNWQMIVMRKYEPWEEELKMYLDRIFESGIPHIFTGTNSKDEFDVNPHARGMSPIMSVRSISEYKMDNFRCW